VVDSDPQSTSSACHGNEVSDNAAPSTTPPPPEVEIDALWTVAMLHPIVYMDSEIGSSVDTIWAGLCDEEDCHIGEQVIEDAEIVTPLFDLNLELFSAIGDAIVADAPIQIASPPNSRQEFQQDILDDILTGVQIVVVEPEDQDHVPKKIKRKPRILQRPVKPETNTSTLPDISPEVYLEDAVFVTGLGQEALSLGRDEREEEVEDKENAAPANGEEEAEKRHRCEVCGKRFKLKGNLKRHILMHTGEKLFLCDLCDQSFTRKEHMETHRRIHTGEKPYVCEMCSMAFSDKTGLRSHMKKH